MRLTLRTLLAYRDNILEPADAQQLGEKIKENANASELTHRIRECMAQPRLSSPAVHGRGVAADANTVAEYLDNTLPVERMPEFERTCLESDVHLSEVASAHQILTMVLGEPAEVDERLRQQAYDLGRNQNDGGLATVPRRVGSSESHRASSGAPPVANSMGATAHTQDASSVAPPPIQPASEFEDAYYDDAAESRRSVIWPVALMLLAGFLITTAVLNGLNWLQGNAQVASSNTDPVASPPVVPSNPANTPPVTSQPPVPPIAPPVTQPLDSPFAGPEINTLAADPVAPPAIAIDTSSANLTAPPAHAEIPAIDVAPVVVAPPPLILQESDNANSANNAIVAPANVPPTQPAIPAIAAAPAETDPLPDALLDPEPITAPAPTAPIDQLADNQPRTGTPLADEDLPVVDPIVSGVPAAGDPDVPQEEPAEEEPAQDVARSVVEDQALALWDTEKQAWTRLPLRAPLRVGQQFRNLPTFRPQLLLIGGLQMTVDGSADFSFGEPSGVDTPRVNFSHGRGLFVGMGQAPSRVELEVAGRVVTVQQGDPNSEFAVEVLRTRAPGSNPATAPRHHIVRIWPVSGRIGISEDEQETLAVESGQMWTSIDQREAKVVVSKQLPKWTAGSRMRDIDRFAMKDFEPLLTQDRSLTLSLQEAAQHRRTDVRSLAARCLASLGRFEPLIETLGDRKQHANWPQHIGQLRMAVDQHPESSALVAQALRRATGPDAEKIMGLLAGVSPPQLANGGAERLINDLESESLEVRVVAIETLKHITGMDQMYQAFRSAAQRKVAVQKWRVRLSEGEVLYARPPLILSGAEEK